MALECYACRLLTLALKVYRCSVEVVYAMLDRVVHESVGGLLVYDVLAVLVLDHWPTHAAISEDADNIAVSRIGPIGHLTFTGLWCSFTCCALASCDAAKSGCDDTCSSCSLEELSSVYILFHSNVISSLSRNLNIFMNFMTLHMDGSKRSCRAEVLTCAATDASLFVHNRDSE